MTQKLLHFIILLFICITHISQAQENWASFATRVNVKQHIGKNFRLSAKLKTTLVSDSGAARLWMRVDCNPNYNFFDNMWERPVRSTEWKDVTIEGKFKEKSEQATFGALCMLNGKFYYDDILLEVEDTPNNWIKLYSNNFEKNTDDFTPGIFINKMGINSNFKKSIITQNTNHCLLVEGSGMVAYGQNKEVGHYANVNGIKLYYEIYGNGHPLLVLHGNGGSIENASNFYDDLTKYYKVIAIDSRAQGNSTDTDKPLTYNQMASDVNELLNQLHIDSTYIWGHSDGAILGILLAKDYPDKVAKVLAFGSNMVPDTSAIYEWDLVNMKKLATQSKDLKMAKLNRMMLDYPNVPYADLHKIKAPVLIMQGDRDMIRPEHALKLFQNIPNSQLCILPGTTHGAAWEKPELFLKLLHTFFDSPFTMPDSKEYYGE